MAATTAGGRRAVDQESGTPEIGNLFQRGVNYRGTMPGGNGRRATDFLFLGRSLAW